MKNEIPPEAVHEVAFVEDQVSVDAAPLTMLVGLALVETVGAGGGEAAATALVSLPPPQATYVAASHAMPPMHARWYVRSLFTGLLSANQCGHGTPELITRTLGQARRPDGSWTGHARTSFAATERRCPARLTPDSRRGASRG